MDKFKHGTMVWNDISCSHLYNYLHGNPARVLIVLLYMETWLIRIVTSYSQHPMCCIYVLYNECLQLQQPFLLLSVSWWGRDYLYVQWFSYYIPYSTQITILIFHISACIYQCISNRWKKLHQLIMETVQRRSILDITRGFELQP